MNKILKLNAIILLMALFTSCGEKTVYEKNIDQPSQGWNIFKPAVFNVDIQDTSKTYKVSIALKLNNQMQEHLIPIDFQMIYPNGENRSVSKYIFKDSAIMVDGFSEFTLQVNKHFNHPGTYHYSFTQRTQKFDLAGVESIGLRLRTVKPKKETEE